MGASLRVEIRGEVELEEWRRSRGAQRCPGCYKIIEKDDAETCNHMVHKVGPRSQCDHSMGASLRVQPHGAQGDRRRALPA